MEIRKWIRENKSLIATIALFISLGMSLYAIIISTRSCQLQEEELERKITPKLNIIDADFGEIIKDLKRGIRAMGITVNIRNESDAYAKDVVVDFINDDGYGVYSRNKYYREEENYEFKPTTFAPHEPKRDG